MRLKFGAVTTLLAMLVFLQPAVTQAQEVVGPAPIRPATDTANVNNRFFLSEWDKPAKAALLSAIIPGAGQVYNKAIWKVPVIYATGAVLGYFLIDNNDKYQDFRQALILRNRDSSDVYVDDPIYGIQRANGTQNLRYSRDFYRRNRDLTIMLSVLAYGLNIAEAYVHAHLREFDVSDDLALRIKPDLIPSMTHRASMAPGVTLVLYTKPK